MPVKLPALLLSLALAIAAPSANAQLTKEAKALHAFGEELDHIATAPDFVGLAVAVVKNGRIEMIRTYGVREAGGKDRVTPDTVFRLASLSKGFASTLAVMEEKDGKLDLSTRAQSYAPQFKLKNPNDAASVTLENVLSHSTGLPPYAYDNLLEAGTSPDEILSGIRAAARGESPLHPKAARELLSARAETPTRGEVELTARETEVLGLVRAGLSNKQIARRLGITERTVKAHLTSCFQRIGVLDRTQAAVWAERHGIG